MSSPILLITPPFTQLNTPYPATAYLKGFLNTKNIPSVQSDLGITTTLAIFSPEGLTKLFSIPLPATASANSQRIYRLQKQYINTIHPVISFLQNKQPSLAHRIAQRNYLPEAARFEQINQWQEAFGIMGIADKAMYLATLFLEDIADYIKETCDEYFGFSRYAESIARSANQFDAIYTALQQPLRFTETFMLPQLHALITQHQPKMIAFSVPFPGNLLAALRCAQYIKQHFPTILTALGGGFANTELRTLQEPRLFELIDFVTLDDGEAPVEQLWKYIHQQISVDELKRCFVVENGEVVFKNNAACGDYKQGQVGTPDYSDFELDKYISAIEIINPMHSLWSKGRWNKLTMAHGCYWGKCTFCDVSLPYISDYEPLTAAVIVNRMEELIAQTGETGFHFVDEAAPPALMRSVAIEILRRGLQVSWWTNIRFEKSFTRDLCFLLKASGCIGVSGGLEVASDRLLALIQKGISVEQVAKVNRHFQEAGIMVHAYLMFGFPTQTAQETIDSLEMVRQMFDTGILQSAFWHRFALTAHSPVGINPHAYGLSVENKKLPTFANNDVVYDEPGGIAHDDFSFGLKKSLFNFMQGIGIEEPLHKWFDFKVPKTTVPPNFIAQCLENDIPSVASTAKVIWLGNSLPEPEWYVQTKKGNSREMASWHLDGLTEQLTIKLTAAEAKWLQQLLPKLAIQEKPVLWSLQAIEKDYEAAGLEHFELFWDNKPINQLYKVGLLQV